MASTQESLFGSVPFAFADRFLMDHAGQIITDPRAAILELIANAYDAGATKITIQWPTQKGDEFSVTDDGGEKLAGYTYAMILDVGQSQMATFLDAISEAKREAWDWYAKNRLPEHDGSPAILPQPEPLLVSADDVTLELAENGMEPITTLEAVSVGVTSQVTQVRVGQDAFSSAVRENYDHRCCFPGCEVDHDALLVGAHIARWADNSKFRGEISNGLCLCGLHDKAFEAGFFTLTDDLTVSVDLHKAPQSAWVASLLQEADGRQITLGRIKPSLDAIREHRNRHTGRP